MRNLNNENGADQILLKYTAIALEVFKNPVGAEMGVAWGGGVEAIGKQWKGAGTIYGFDTFEGHPTELSYDKDSFEAICMSQQYARHGEEGLSYEYQRAELDRQGLNNVILVKGRIHKHSLDGIAELHYCLVDLDMLNPMALGISIALPKMAKGGFLCLHDVIPRGHIFGLWGLYQEVFQSDEYKHVEYAPKSHLVVLEKL